MKSINRKIAILQKQENFNLFKLFKVYIFISITISIFISCSSDTLSGVYQTNVASYGMFGKTLVLNCDSSASLNFAGDLMNDTSYGSWKYSESILEIEFDTINHPYSRYKGTVIFFVKGKRIYYKPFKFEFSKSDYDELKYKIESSGNDTLKLMSYRKMKRGYDKVIVDFKCTMKRQYFVKRENIKCNY